MENTLATAFVLHQRPYRENSLLLDVLTEQYGRIKLVAKGVKKYKRSHIADFQLYQPLLLSWFGRGELQTLSSSEVAEPRYILQAEAALCGLYLNELLIKLLPLHDAEAALFKAYQVALLRLQDVENNNDSQIALRLFEKTLLTELGYGLTIEHDSETGQAIKAEQQYYYQADEGLKCWQGEPQQAIISGRSLLHLSTEQGFDPQSLVEIKQLMRTVIHFYLGGKPLKSRQMFTEMQHYLS